MCIALSSVSIFDVSPVANVVLNHTPLHSHFALVVMPVISLSVHTDIACITVPP